MKKFLFITFIFALVFASAQADDLGVANDFNAFIFEGANTTGGHSEGAVAVGGGWNMAYEVNRSNLGASTITGTSNVSMYVGGISTQGSPEASTEMSMSVSLSLERSTSRTAS